MHVITEANALQKQIRPLSLTNQSAADLGRSVIEPIAAINLKRQTQSVIDRQRIRNRLDVIQSVRGRLAAIERRKRKIANKKIAHAILSRLHHRLANLNPIVEQAYSC